MSSEMDMKGSSGHGFLDARIFFEVIAGTTSWSYEEKLMEAIFIGNLGTMLEKAERVNSHAEWLYSILTSFEIAPTA